MRVRSTLPCSAYQRWPHSRHLNPITRCVCVTISPCERRHDGQTNPVRPYDAELAVWVVARWARTGTVVMRPRLVQMFLADPSVIATPRRHSSTSCQYYWLMLAASQLTRRLFAAMLQRIYALPVPAG